MTALSVTPFETVPFAQHEVLFLKRLAALGYQAETIFDIGAAQAAWSAAISEVYPEAQYHLFEPLAGRHQDYDRFLEPSTRERTNFHLHPVALGKTNGHAEFWYHPGGYGSSLICVHQPAEERISVPVHRLDDLVANASLPQPQIIKADVQGGEYEIIEGGSKTFAAADILHLETWLERGYGKRTPLLHELIEILTPLNFRIVQFGNFWRNQRELLASVDVFFASARLIDRLAAQANGFPWPPTNCA